MPSAAVVSRSWGRADDSPRAMPRVAAALRAFKYPGFPDLESNAVYSISSKERNDRRPTTVTYGVLVFSLEIRSSRKLECELDDQEMAMRGETPSWILPCLNNET
ncbi:hypothetical protein U9M48_022061 [Paspalum notatum var. saurae]|uniref:Uncharacterized protein n=1 Tax=Paspalum notatum var. saurae TaxID=547442 RepID=A0AAQ3TM42_PASNO